MKDKLERIYRMFETENKEKNNVYSISEITKHGRHLGNKTISSNISKVQWINSQLSEMGWVYEYILKHPDCLLLDVGCGWGEYSIMFGMMGATVVGVDFDRERLNLAKKRLNFFKEHAKELGISLNVSFVKKDVFEILTSEKINVVWAREAISHIHPVEDFFDNVCKNITNDGILAISDANWSNPKRKLSLIRNYRKRWRPFSKWGEATIWWVYKYKDPETEKEYEMAMERVFSPWKIKQILKRSNFVIDKFKTSGFLPKGIISKIFPNSSREYVYILLSRIEEICCKIPILRNFGGTIILTAKPNT